MLILNKQGQEKVTKFAQEFYGPGANVDACFEHVEDRVNNDDPPYFEVEFRRVGTGWARHLEYTTIQMIPGDFDENNI